MKFKTVYYVRRGKKKIGKPYETYDEAAGFLEFLVIFKPFVLDYNIKECKKLVKGNDCK